MPQFFPPTLQDGRRVATCHPEKPLYNVRSGLCRACYDRKRFAERPELHEKKKARHRPYVAKWYRAHDAPRRVMARLDYAARGHVYKRGQQLRIKYGITLEQFAKMEEDQNGVCAICKLPPRSTTNRRRKFLCVDHDGKTGRVRGLLCYSCNSGIAMLAHDVSFLASAILYLERTE